MISKRDSVRGIEPDFNKRYWVAEYYPYYPCGFLSDVEYTTDDLNEALSLVNRDTNAIYELWDSVNKLELIKYDSDARKYIPKDA